MAAYQRRMTLKVTCGLSACTPKSAPGPALGNEYGRILTFIIILILNRNNNFNNSNRIDLSSEAPSSNFDY